LHFGEKNVSLSKLHKLKTTYVSMLIGIDRIVSKIFVGMI